RPDARMITPRRLWYPDLMRRLSDVASPRRRGTGPLWQKRGWRQSGIDSSALMLLQPDERRTAPSVEAEERLHTEHQDRADRAHRFADVDLRRPGTTIGEDDRRFADLAAGLATAIQHFLLKRIAARDDAIEPDLSEFGNAVATIRSARVAGRDAK